MSVLICGSRDPKNPFLAKVTVDDMIAKMTKGMVILNGGARGIDSYVIDAVKRDPMNVVVDLGTDWTYPYRPVTDALTCLIFRPDWKRHGKRAGIMRNIFMLDLHPEMIVCLWNGESNGTRHVIEGGRERQLATVVIEA